MTETGGDEPEMTVAEQRSEERLVNNLAHIYALHALIDEKAAARARKDHDGTP